ncbi:hypothetical protein WDZ17_02525 [Pseudokineococcus basanitobsidens]|uniref:Copper(I)-binding protein n=1 Tax=Pseudokineococcus basanitobsidens TaxID=1926649 RepID=A0ABU8RGF8_9ACTN
MPDVTAVTSRQPTREETPVPRSPRTAVPAARRVATALAAVALLATGSGCAVSPAVNQFSTELQYAPSDGVQGYFPLAQEGQTDAQAVDDAPQSSLLVRNLLLIGPEADGPARLYGVLVNESDDERVVDVQGPGGLRAAVTVPAGTSVPFGEEQTQDPGSQDLPDGAEITGDLTADPVDAVPGTLVQVRMAVDDALLEIGVPLLNGSLPEYQTLVPTSAATTPSPTDGATPLATEEPSTADVSGEDGPGAEGSSGS